MAASSKPETAGIPEVPVVVIVDDDSSVREALSSLLRSVGLRVEAYPAPQEFLQSAFAQTANCLVLDIRLPMISGLDFQKQLTADNFQIPVVFMTGHGDIPMSVQAMKAGAVDFLAKPFRDQDMLDAVSAAVARDRARRKAEAGLAALRQRFQSLSQREQEIMALATSGLMNKQIAAEVGLSEITVKIHRGRVMRKLEAQTFADLVRIAEALGVRAVRAPVK